MKPTIKAPARTDSQNIRSMKSDCEITALKIARELIVQKLLGKERVVRKFFKESPSSSVIVESRRSVVQSKTNDDIRRWEAKGALAYWSTMRDVQVNFSKGDASKIPEH